MDLRNVHTFLRVAELKSFTKVAQELSYAQSTVTMQIQQLERELGFPLFDRIGKTVSLTALGEGFLTYAYEITRMLYMASSLGQDTADIHGTLRLGVLESLLFGTVAEVLPDFKRRFQNVNLQLKMGQTTQLLQQLKQNELDIVYLSSDLNVDPDLRCCYKRREELVFLASPEHPLAARKGITLEELLENCFVVTERSGVCYGRLQELAADHNGALHASVEVDSTLVIAELVKKGMGLAFLPEYSVRTQLQEGTLVRLDAALEPQMYYSQILCHKSRWLSPFMAGFIEQIRQLRPENDTAAQSIPAAMPHERM